jgi:ATP-binding cassette subfamily B multidrug efflux pump
MEKKLAISSKDQGRILKRLLTYANPHRKKIYLTFILLGLTVLGDILGPILVKVFIDDYLTKREFPFRPLLYIGSAYLFIQIANAFITYFQLMSFQKIALKIIQQLRIDVFSKVHSLGMRYFDQTPAGGIVSRVTNDTEAIKDMFVSVLATFLQSGVMFVGIFIAMFLLNVKLAFFCLFIMPFVFLIIGLYRKYSSFFYQDMRERLSQLNAKLNESLQGMQIIQVFRQEKRMKEEYGEVSEKLYQAGMKMVKMDGLLLRPAVDLVYVVALIMVLSFFGITSMNSPIEIGVLVAFVTYLDRFFEPVNQILMRLSLFQQAIVAGSRVFTLLDETEKAPNLSNKTEEIRLGEVSFEGISFSYNGKQDVLKNISFTAKPGETVALVGHTGSGKSSIINLLMRFYEYERGEIKIDGISIKEYSKTALRDKMGLVLQDPFLFYGNLEDNIRMYNSEISSDDAINASKFVQAHSFIEELPDQYQHKVVERGSTFSSGQRQLIAFARTIATNPKILILDEATANIDTETEEAIQVALERMRRGRTTIAIAHRLSTIQDADLILVLHHGEVVERGTHQELLLQRGLYHKMYLLQNGLSDRSEKVVDSISS